MFLHINVSLDSLYELWAIQLCEFKLDKYDQGQKALGGKQILIPLKNFAHLEDLQRQTLNFIGEYQVFY